MLTIVIVEDNVHFADALSEIIENINEAVILSIYEDGEKAVEEIPALSPHIVIIDVQLKGQINGIDVIRQSKSALSNTEFLVCTIHDDSTIVFDALKYGASGYILKDANTNEIKNAILEVANGGSPMSPFIARKVITSFRKITSKENSTQYGLTIRETEVIELVAKGLLYKEIAANMQITLTTVKKHIRNIYEKLHVQNKVEAVNKFKSL